MMRNQPVARRGLYVLAVVTAVAATVLATGSLAAPTTKGLILQTASAPGAAIAGNRNEAYVLVAIYNEAGPVRGIPSGSLSVAIVAAPVDADPVRKVDVTEPVSGVYRVTLAPELSSHRWSSGKYVVSITVTSANGSGVALGSLEIGS